MKDIDAIKALVEQREAKRLMQQHGITDDEIREYKELNSPKEMTADDAMKALFPDDISDEEILYWATPYYDELQAQKELKTKRIKEEVRDDAN